MVEHNLIIPNVSKNSINDTIDITQHFELIEEKVITTKKFIFSKLLKSLDQKKFYFFNQAITDTNFKNVSNKLKTNTDYLIKIFQIKKNVTSENCIKFLKNQNAIFVGAQGEAILWQEHKILFPISKWLISFDEKNNLFIDKDIGNDYRVPMMFHHISNSWKFGLGNFRDNWNSDYCLLAFCKCS